MQLNVSEVLRPDYANRQARIESALREAGLVAAILMDRRNVFYLVGTGQPCNLLITPGRPPVLYARRVADWVRSEALVARVEEASSLRPVVARLRELGLTRGRVGLELDVLPARLFLKAQETLAGYEIADVAPLMLGERMVKDDFEQQQLGAAAAMYSAVHDAILRHLRPGIREIDLAGEMARAVRQAGHEGLSFYRRWDAHLQAEGIVASGPNLARISGFAMTVTGVGLSRALPWGASDRVVEAGDVVVVDLGLNRAGYHADMSRTYVVGAADDFTREAFAVVLACQQAAIDVIKPGVLAEQVFDAARSVVAGSRWEQHLQGFGSEQAHYIGHGVGLDLDEPPVLAVGDRTPLHQGMALTIEPKLIGPDFGAVQVEDTIVVTSIGTSILSSVPRQLFEVRPS